MSSEAGYQVSAAADVDEAIGRLQQLAVDVVVSDLVMPGRNGLELLAWLRGQQPRVPLVLMTGEPGLESAAAAIRGGAALLAVRDEITIQWFGDAATTLFALPVLVIFAVGGTSLIALIALIIKSARGPIAAMVPGILLAGYIILEVLVFKPEPPVPTLIGIVYFSLGLLMITLAVLLSRRSAAVRRLSRQQTT